MIISDIENDDHGYQYLKTNHFSMPHYPCGVERNSNADKLIIIIYVWTFQPPVLPPPLPRGKTSPASTFIQEQYAML